MLDAPKSAALAPTLDRVGARLARAGVPALALTGAGWLAGVGACVAAGAALWPLALVLWLTNRLLDGLDGPVARWRGATDQGGFLDIVADFSIYAGFVVGVAFAVPAARLASSCCWPPTTCPARPCSALAALLEKRRHESGDGRSLRFAGGLAEGTETTIAYVLFCVFPAHAQLIAWAFAAAVIVTAVQRVSFGIRVVSSPETLPETTATMPPERARP